MTHIKNKKEKLQVWSYSSVIFQSKVAIPQPNSGFSNTGDKQKVISASFF